jgi:type IV pilus assembly protein PilB
MGIPSFLISSTLNMSVAQRLVRLLCTRCKKFKDFNGSGYPGSFRPFYKIDSHFVPGGCDSCYNTGFSGRKAVYEVLPIDNELAMLIKAGEMNAESALKAKGIKSLAQNAFDMFAAGETSLEEIYPLLLN